MSRIGKRPVPMPAGVTATTEGQILSVKGPKGTLSLNMVDEVTYDIADGAISVQVRARPAAPPAINDLRGNCLKSTYCNIPSLRRYMACAVQHAPT